MRIIIVVIIMLEIFNINLFPQQNVTLQYDNLYRLTKVDYGNGSIINYTYDANGNRLTEVVTGVSLPSPPVLSSPANNSNETSLTPALIWGNVSGASNYRIQLSTDSLFLTPQYDTSGITATLLTVPAGKLLGLTKYFWRVCASNIAGTGSWSTVWNFKTIQNLPLNLKVYLEGFWNGSVHITDTLMIILANPAAPFAFVDTTKVVLNTTGTIPISFSRALNGNYFIVIKHRNHLETWSAIPQIFTTNMAVNYDFTTSQAQAYGSNMKQVGSVWVLYGGDPNADGSIDAFDVPIFLGQFGMLGYLSADFNGDESVDASDMPIFLQNFGLLKQTPVGLNIEPLKETTKKNKVKKIFNKKIRNKK